NGSGTGNGITVSTQNGPITGNTSASIKSDSDINITAIGGNVSIGALIDNSSSATAGTADVTVDSTTGSVTVAAVTSKGNISIGDQTGTTGVTLNGNLNNSTGSGDILVYSFNGAIAGGGSNISSSGGLTVQTFQS